MSNIEPLNDAGRQHLDTLPGLLHADQEPEATLDDLIVTVDDPVVADLLRRLIADGELSNQALEEAGRRCGVTGRTMRNRVNRAYENLAPGTLAPPQAWQLDHDTLEVIAAHGGCVTRAYHDLEAQGIELPSLATVWRRWRALPAAFRGFVTDGREGMLPAWTYVPYTAPHPNAVWQGDYVPLPVDVIPDGHETTLVSPHLLVFQDDRTRVVTAWAVECRPNRRGTGELSTATLAIGFEGVELDGIRIGGIPEVVRVDNDAAFLCEEMDEIAAAIGVHIRAVPPSTPFMKGKIESVGKIVQNECVALMQGYTHGPRSYSGRNPFRDAAAITEATLVAFLDDYFTHYNRSRVHSQLDHGTPLRQWAEEAQNVRFASSADVRWFLFPVGRDYKVHKSGIWWDGRYWTGPGITRLTNRTVTFRYPKRRDVERIEVFHGNRWAMTAWPADTLTADQRAQILEERNAIYNQAINVVEDATARRGDATAAAAETGGLISPAAAPNADLYAANPEDLWAIIGDEEEGDSPAENPGPFDDPDGEQAEETSENDPPEEESSEHRPPRRRRQRTKRQPVASRRRVERPDSEVADDLWELFDDEPGAEGSDELRSEDNESDPESPGDGEGER